MNDLELEPKERELLEAVGNGKYKSLMTEA